MKQEEIIKIASKCGLLHLSEEFPKNTPVHMRLISRLEKFAELCYNEGYDIGATEAIERERG